MVTFKQVVECAEEGCLEMLDEGEVADAVREAFNLLRKAADSRRVDDLVRDGYY
jgi:hypothetical protein